MEVEYARGASVAVVAHDVGAGELPVVGGGSVVGDQAGADDRLAHLGRGQGKVPGPDEQRGPLPCPPRSPATIGGRGKDEDRRPDLLEARDRSPLLLREVDERGMERVAPRHLGREVAAVGRGR